MSDNNQTKDLRFTESDNGVTRVIISAFIDIYNSYYRATRIVDLDGILAGLVIHARALREIGEVDQTACDALEQMCKDLSAQMTNVGRSAATILQFMASKRGEEGGMEAVEEQWPDLVSEDEQ